MTSVLCPWGSCKYWTSFGERCLKETITLVENDIAYDEDGNSFESFYCQDYEVLEDD
jgi:hypothetical protein